VQEACAPWQGMAGGWRIGLGALDETGGTGLRVQRRRQRLREHGRTGGGTYTQGAGAGVRAAFWAEDGG